MTEINDQEAISAGTQGTVAAAMSAREAAWAAVRGRQQAADLSGLVLAQMALELIDAAARHRDEQSFVRGRERGGRMEFGAESDGDAGPGNDFEIDSRVGIDAGRGSGSGERAEDCDQRELELAGARG